ncbi:MAG: hypothetical protein R3C61_19450 [Bacteroidia bacterium]
MRKRFAATLILALPVFLLMSAFTGTYETSLRNITGGAYLTFAGKYGGDISTSEIAKSKELGVAGCFPGTEILQFTLYVKKDGKTQSFTGSASKLSTEVMTALRTLKKGDSFYFEKIKARIPEGKTVDVRSEEFRVV